MVRLTPFLMSLSAVLSCITLTGASPTGASSTSSNGVTAYDKRSFLEKRVQAGTLCATVPLIIHGVPANQPDINLGTSVCACIDGNQLTDASNDAVNAAVVTAPNLAAGLSAYGTLAAVQAQARVAARDLLTEIDPNCNYPTNSEPACPNDPGAVQITGTSCYFTCEEDYKNCGQFCIPCEQSCVSGIPQRRHFQQTVNLCPSGLTACYLGNVASLPNGRSVSWECMDTQRHIEACGGCPFANGGGKSGTDCTAMDGVNEVACVRGRCEALTCMRGFKLNSTECILDTNHKSFWARHA